MTTTTQKPKTGRLVWIENRTGRMVTIITGTFALCQHERQRIEEDPQYRTGTFKLKY